MSGDRSGPEFERHRRGGGNGTDQSVVWRGATTHPSRQRERIISKALDKWAYDNLTGAEIKVINLGTECTLVLNPLPPSDTESALALS
jgi:hypothetical protein